MLKINKLWGISLIACMILSSESQAGLLDSLKSGLDSYNKIVQQQAKQQAKQQEEFSMPEFSSLGQKKQWMDSQKDIYNKEVDKYNAAFDVVGSNLLVGQDDTQESIDAKSKNATALIQNLSDRLSALSAESRRLDSKERILFPYKEGEEEEEDSKSSSDNTKQYLTCQGNKFMFINLDTPYEALRDCSIVSMGSNDYDYFVSLKHYKEYLEYAYNNIDDLKAEAKAAKAAKEAEEAKEAEAKIAEAKEAKEAKIAEAKEAKIAEAKAAKEAAAKAAKEAAEAKIAEAKAAKERNKQQQNLKSKY